MSEFDKINQKNKRLNSSNIILSKCLLEKNYEFFLINLDINILPENIKQIIQYIEFFRDKYKKHPTFEEVEIKFINFSDIVDVDVSENYSNDFLIDKVKAEYKKTKMISSMEEFAMKLDEDKIDEAFTFFSKEIDAINKIDNQKASTVSLFKDGSSILNIPNLKGWSYGLPSLDRHIGGISPGQFIVVCARPKGNKSFFTRSIALNLIRQGVDVFYCSFETSKLNELRNFISLASHVDPFLFVTQILSNEERERIDQTILRFKELGKTQIFEIFDATCFHKLTPSMIFSTIQPMIKDPKKSVIIIDQASWLYDDEQSPNQNTILTNISKACVNFTSTTQIPLITLFQASRDATQRIIPSSKDIQWSDRPLQDCHVALALGATPDMKISNKKYVKTIANRVGTETCLVMDFDIQRGIFKECESDVTDPDENTKKENLL